MQLKAGQLQMIYDQGFLRYIKLGNHEVLRMIYFALRDHNWDTMPGFLEDEKIETEERSFRISYRWISTMKKFPFIWHVSIEGRETSEIIFSIRGSAQKDVYKNRSGFCILHSIKENAGGPCLIIQPDGQSKEGIFPRFISPHQPFFEISEMQWPLANYGEAMLHFSGEVFETEDQRNWSDDSYKTYCTPLRLPFPALLQEGEEVHQTVHLTLKPNIDAKIPELTSGCCILEPRSPMDKTPKIGVASPTKGRYLTSDEIEILGALQLDHYRIELDMSEVDWQKELNQRIEEAMTLKLDLELSLFFTDRYHEEASLLANYLDQFTIKLKAYLLILHKDHKTTPTHLLQSILPILGNLKHQFLFGAGTSAYFTELNRERVDTWGLQFVSYSVNPQVHAFDNASLTENAQAQRYTVESARHYFPGQMIHVSPVTLSPRFNPNATGTESALPVGLPSDVDVRQMDLFGAAWTLASLQHLGEAGADMITYFQATGWKGVMQGSEAPALPTLFPAKKKMLFPLFHIIRCFMQHKEVEWLPFSSTLPLSLQAVGFRENDRLRLLLANFKDKSLEAQIRYPCSKYKVFTFDGNNLADSYFDAGFLSRSLEQSPVNAGSLPSLLITANAIIYAELFD